MSQTFPAQPNDNNRNHTDRNQSSWRYYAVLTGLMLLAVTMKTLPYLLARLGVDIQEDNYYSYLWNFSPLLPLAVVLGATCSARNALFLAALTWLLGDLGVWAASGRADWAFYKGQPIIYLCLGLVVLTGYAGSFLNQQTSLTSRIATNLGSGLAGAMLFFLVSNFLIWLLGNEVRYPHTWAGLLECYTLAIPFHRNDFLSMLIFVPCLTALLPAPAEDYAPATYHSHSSKPSQA